MKEEDLEDILPYIKDDEFFIGKTVVEPTPDEQIIADQDGFYGFYRG